MAASACAPASPDASAAAGAAASADTPQETASDAPADSASATDTDSGSSGLDVLEPRALVAYFSATGRTKQAADAIARTIHAELFEIKPKEPYTADDLDYTSDSSRSTTEIRENARPAIAEEPVDIRQYDVVYLGYPIWGGQAPPIIRTFLDSNDLSGMKVVPFCTSGSTGISRSEDTLKEEYPDIDWQEGVRIANPEEAVNISEWSDDLGFWPFGE